MTPRLFLLFLFAFVANLSLVFSTGAQESSGGVKPIAVIDLAKVFESHPDTKAATAKLTKDRETLRDNFKKASNALKETLQKHQELIRAGKKTEAAELLKTANEQEKAVAALRTTQQRDLEESFRQTKNAILDAIRKVVAEHNKDGKYAVVIDRSAESAFGVPAVIDASGADDITTEIIAKLKATPAPAEKKSDQ